MPTHAAPPGRVTSATHDTRHTMSSPRHTRWVAHTLHDSACMLVSDTYDDRRCDVIVHGYGQDFAAHASPVLISAGSTAVAMRRVDHMLHAHVRRKESERVSGKAGGGQPPPILPSRIYRFRCLCPVSCTICSVASGVPLGLTRPAQRSTQHSVCPAYVYVCILPPLQDEVAPRAWQVGSCGLGG